MWQEKDNALYKKFEFADFEQAFKFMTNVAKVAELHQHHPKWTNIWNTVEIWLSTHDSGGKITAKDTNLAKSIDKIDMQNVSEINESDQTVSTEVKLYTDGGSRGNPGPSAGGFVIFGMDGSQLASSGKYLGITTNNQAEYHSLKGGLEKALQMQCKIVHVYMDSQLVINQMLGIYKIKNQDLFPIYQAIKELLPNFNKVTFTHVLRELNKAADAMVNEALDARQSD